MQKVVFVSGANRGIGLAIARRLCPAWHVVAGARNPGPAVEGDICDDSGNVTSLPFDLDDELSIKEAAHFIDVTFGGLDGIIANAGVSHLDNATMDAGVARALLRTNVTGTVLTMRHMLPLANENCNVVIMSSTLATRGSLSSPSGKELLSRANLSVPDLDGVVHHYLALWEDGPEAVTAAGWPGLGIGNVAMSKLCLNALTRILANLEPGKPNASRMQVNARVRVNAACPGYVKTALTGFQGKGTAEDGAEVAVLLASLPPASPLFGGLFRARDLKDVLDPKTAERGRKLLLDCF